MQRSTSPGSILDQAIDVTNLVELINEVSSTPETAYLSRERGGCICDPRPGREEQDASFSVYLARNGPRRLLYKRHGHDYDFGNAHQYLTSPGLDWDPGEAARYLIRRAGLEGAALNFPPRPAPRREPALYVPPLPAEPRPGLTAAERDGLRAAQARLERLWPVRELERRGFTLAAALALEFGTDSSGSVYIPLHSSEGELLAVKVRRAEPVPKRNRFYYLGKGYGTPPWRSPNFGKARAVFVAEGEMSAAAAYGALEFAGLKVDVLGLPGRGARLTEEGLEGLDVLIYADAVKAGEDPRATWGRSALELGARSARVLKLLKHGYDFCDVLGKYGVGPLAEWLRRAIRDAAEVGVGR